jgi:hypothetical protein
MRGDNVKQHTRLAVLALLVAIATPACTWAQATQFEITPFVGFRFGGGFKAGTVNQPTLPALQELKIKEGFNYGLIVDITLVEGLQLEFWGERQNTTLEVKDGGAADTLGALDLNLYYAHAGVLWEVNKSYERPLRPIVGLTIGATFMNPKEVGRSTETRFSISLVGGIKYFPGDAIGFRLQTRIVGTYLADNNSIFCVGESCYTIPETAYMVQLDISGGVIIPVF